MKIVILAAGMGKRMGNLTKSTPKPLLYIGNKTILEHKIHSLKELGFKEKDMVIVVGYLKKKKEKEIPKVKLIYNKDYAIKNNMYSLWLTRNYTKEGFMLFNADTLYTKDIFKEVVKYNNHKNSYIVIDSKIKDPDDLCAVVDKFGRVLESRFGIDKRKISGKCVQISKFNKKDTVFFMDYIMRCIAREEFEHGANIMDKNLLKKINLFAIDIKGLPWFEIDTPKDLDNARKMFR